MLLLSLGRGNNSKELKYKVKDKNNVAHQMYTKTNQRCGLRVAVANTDNDK
jgi:hypothetical protein